MNLFLKSAGRSPEQDYVWLPLETGGPGGALPLLALAERAVPNRGTVQSVHPSPPLVALFFGNVASGRTDFQGTPILNRLGAILDTRNPDDLVAARRLALAWFADPSPLAGLLASAAPAADVPSGFVPAPEFRDRLLAILPPDDPADPRAREFLAGVARLWLPPPPPPVPSGDGRGDGAPSRGPGGAEIPGMAISINTVPSGHADYGWYFGGRPGWAAPLDNLCDPVRVSTSDKSFFAALEAAPESWRLLLQDCIGVDSFTRRPARATIAIEIPASVPDSASCARRLLASWLDPDGGLLPLFKACVDVSSDTVRVDERGLHEGMAGIASGPPLASAPASPSRIVRRLARDNSNLAGLRREAAGYVSTHAFPPASGVQFLFSFAPYSTDPASGDSLPSIPAPFVVLGHRDEPAHPSSPPSPPPPPSLPNQPWWIVVAALSVLIVAAAVRSCHGGGRHVSSGLPPPGSLSDPTSTPTVNLQTQEQP